MPVGRNRRNLARLLMGGAGKNSDGQPPTGVQPGLPHRPSGGPGRNATAAAIVWARWSLRLLLIGAGLYALSWIARQMWALLLPLLLALLLSTILWPPVRWLRRRLPPALAALIGVLGLLGAIVAVVILLIQVISSQAQGLADEFSAGLSSLRSWLAGPPLSLGRHPIGAVVDDAVVAMQHNTQAVAGTALTVIGQLASVVLDAVLALVLAFFMLKDGPRFLPWLHGWTGAGNGRHIEEVARRSWTALSHFIYSHAAVALADAILIGIGIWIIGVPFVLPIAILIFFGAFVPIVGAFATGTIATLVATVSGGIWAAVATLAVVIVVEQLEGNVMQPLIVGRTLHMYPAVVIAVVTLGGSLFGITGAFLAVPAVAVLTVILRYAREEFQDGDEGQESADSGEAEPPNV